MAAGSSISSITCANTFPLRYCMIFERLRLERINESLMALCTATRWSSRVAGARARTHAWKASLRESSLYTTRDPASPDTKGVVWVCVYVCICVVVCSVCSVR